MTEKTPATLDRLWDNIPTGSAPVGDLLTAGHAVNRRKRNTRIVGVAAVTVLLIGGVATQQALTATGDQANDLVADAGSSTYAIQVNTTLEGPAVYYMEGALQEVHLISREDPEHPVAVTPSVDGDTAPGRYVWDNLAPGEYTLEGAIRPCSGSCDNLDPPTDSCQQDLTLNADTEVALTFRYGQPCTITNIGLEPKWRGTMEVSPGEAEPGQTVALTFPPEHRDIRGVAFSLSGWTTDGWKVTHYLTSGSDPSTEPSWWSVEDAEGRGWVDVGVSGAGPDYVIVPDTATEGTHLLCTANASDEKCTLIQVRTE